MAAPRKTAASKPKTEVVELPKDEPSEVTEETVETKEFEFRGQTYSVPTDPMDLPIEMAYVENDYDMVETILGPDQWARFRSTRPTIRHFGDFSELVLRTCGYGDAGN
ncbi:hypothetical protein ACFWNC_14575 [Streptomyces sp. NPDC058369]|uniref:hypothetical protein n=1 Tax=Streptomyces sp. NPDC058369 TaxID=3346462 RepID=UPI003660DF0E